MSGEEAEETVSVALSGELADWLDGRADEDRDREAVVRDLLAAYRRVADDGIEADAGAEAGAGDGTVGGDLDPAELDRRLESMREEYASLVEDVRERVIQVKHEADAKARADHAHPDVESSIEAVEGRVAELDEAVDALRSTVEDARAEIESGFDNYEDALRSLKDLTEELDDHQELLARAVVGNRETLYDVAAAEAAREAVDDLKLTANRRGISTADCEACGSAVEVGLLTHPECPHCGRAFADVEPKDGFFGSHRLLTGTPPALAGDVGLDGTDLTAIVDEDGAAEHASVDRETGDPAPADGRDRGNGADREDAAGGADAGGEEEP